MSDSDNNDSDKDDNGGSESSCDKENENDCIDSGDRDESSDVILAFIDDEEEVREEPQPENQKLFLFFSIFFQRIHEFRTSWQLAHFFFADFVVYSRK